MRTFFLLGLTAVPALATAGSGPWTLSPRDNNVYVGGDYFRFSRFRGAEGSQRDLFTGVTAAGLTGVWTLGLAYGLEWEMKVSFESARANDPDTPLCHAEGRPSDFCRPSANLGDLGAVLKWRVLDEAYAGPVSLALALGARSGEAYANTRRRFTNLGDGNTDVGLGVSLGRTATLAQGWYALSASAWYWHRFSNAAGSSTPRAPRDEVAWETELMLTPHPRFGVGPAASGFARLGGINVEDADFMDYNVWNRLAAHQIKVGGKLGIYTADNGPTVSLTVLTTLYARNNPSNTFGISAGIGWFRPAPPRDP